MAGLKNVEFVWFEIITLMIELKLVCKYEIGLCKKNAYMMMLNFKYIIGDANFFIKYKSIVSIF